MICSSVTAELRECTQTQLQVFVGSEAAMRSEKLMWNVSEEGRSHVTWENSGAELSPPAHERVRIEFLKSQNISNFTACSEHHFFRIIELLAAIIAARAAGPPQGFVLFRAEESDDVVIITRMIFFYELVDGSVLRS